jgi:class 3 adenylate cyclase
MFADIRDFTAMSEKLDPGRVVEVLNEFFTRVTDLIFDHGGMIDKYIGDAVMAVFGAPISKGNDAANAVESAIQIQRIMAEMNLDAEARHWPELAVGIGINTGVVTAGNIGSPRRLDYTVMGDSVNIASRLVAHAPAGQIFISQSTAAELGEKFQLVSLPALRLKGRKERVSIFRVGWAERAGRKKRSARKAKNSRAKEGS